MKRGWRGRTLAHRLRVTQACDDAVAIDGETAESAFLPRTLRTMSLTSQLSDFAGTSPEARALAEDFAAFHASHADVFERHHALGHMTASCWLVSRDGRRVLLTHHRKLDRWLQLGGHADGDSDLARVALREAEEESGLTDLRVEPAIFDLDRHRIPARGSEPEHWHYDVRFVVVAEGSEDFVVSEESLALAWREIAPMPGDATLDVSMRRMAAAWLAREGAA